MPSPLAAHFLLDPAVTFLNHGSYGACPRPVFEAYQAWQRALERQPVAFLDPARGWSDRLAHVRHVLGAFVGADPMHLVAVPNATVALNIAIQSLDLGEGDEIVLTDHEYSALEKTWTHVARRTGARLVVARVPLPLASAEAFTQAMVGAFTARTRVVFMSHITSATALLFPIAPVIAAARARGIVSVIDGAHAPGQIPLALDALGADIYAGNAHKWLMAPKGSAFLYVRPEWQHRIAPRVISHGWSPGDDQPGARGPFGGSAFIDSLQMQGTQDPAALLAVPDAIAFRRDHGWDAVAVEAAALARRTEARVAALTGLPALAAPDFRAPQMAAMPLPPCDPAAVKVRLYGEYGIEIPVYAWTGRPIARVSAQGYNDDADMDRLVDALREVLAL